MKLSTFNLEKKFLSDGYEIIIGIDEAGRGPLAGPVVASAAVLRNSVLPDDLELWNLVRDSKTLNSKQREEIFKFVSENFYIGIGVCDHETIDRINILQASFLAMKKAISDLSNKIENFKSKKVLILADGKAEIPNLSLMQKTIVGGDSTVKSISAASIIAKVTRDRVMMEMHEKFPQYGFNSHKGYGTKKHMDCLKKYGPCAFHRKSFKPVKKALNLKALSV